jgi:hypothetical protein
VAERTNGCLPEYLHPAKPDMRAPEEVVRVWRHNSDLGGSDLNPQSGPRRTSNHVSDLSVHSQQLWVALSELHCELIGLNIEGRAFSDFLVPKADPHDIRESHQWVTEKMHEPIVFELTCDRCKS